MKQPPVHTAPTPQKHTIFAPIKGVVKETIIRATIRKAGTMLTLLLLAVSCFGQKPLMPTVADYVLPAAQWSSLTTMPDSGKVCTGYGDEDPNVYEMFSYNAYTRVVSISLWNTVVLFREANSIEEEYNEYTGTRAIHFYTLSANDCGKKYHMKASYYERPSSKGFCFTYESTCEGVSIIAGDTMLPKAMKYKPPTKTTTRKYKNYVSKS